MTQGSQDDLTQGSQDDLTQGSQDDLTQGSQDNNGDVPSQDISVSSVDTPREDEDVFHLDRLFSLEDRDSNIQDDTDLTQGSQDFGLITRERLVRMQQDDESLRLAKESAISKAESEEHSRCFYLEDGLLMRKWLPRQESPVDWMAHKQIVVPVPLRERLLALAHNTPVAGHCGVRKTRMLLLKHFFWPSIQRDVATHCRHCHVCQIVGKPNKSIPKAPLFPVPALCEPFTRILIDCVGPLPPSRKGHRYLLTIMCLSSRFPEAIPLRNIRAKTVARELVKYFTLMGFPREIQSDQGSNFMSDHFQQTLEKLGVTHIVSAPYHPESQGALERFHGTLKTMLRKYVHEFQTDWEEGLPFLLFAARTTYQESLGFSPAELIFGHNVRGPLKMIKEHWMRDNSRGTNLSHNIDKLKEIWQIAKDNLIMSQTRMKKRYDRKVKARTFSKGEQVLLYIPKPGDPLQVKYQGPYTVVDKINSLNYLISTPDRRSKTRLCHINSLKEYAAPKVVCTSTTVGDAREETFLTPPELPLKNSIAIENLSNKLSHLDSLQQKDITHLVNSHLSLFSNIPRQHSGVEYDFTLLHNEPIKQPPYRLNPEKRHLLRKEVQSLLDQDLIEISNSPYSSPCLLVPKPDGSSRLVVDYRKLNSITKGDAYPMPRIDDLIEFVGNSRYVTKIDLLKGYHQIALRPSAREKTAFITPDGLFQYKVLPFGLRTAPAIFQRVINTVIADMPNIKSYLDDIILCSNTWNDHMKLLNEFFVRLEEANLTVNLEKSEFGHAKVSFLGHEVGNSTLTPLEMKVQAIKNLPAPKNKKDVRRIIGCFGFYRKFCKNFADVCVPLTNLLKKNAKFTWDASCQRAFANLKLLLTNSPVLRPPDYSKPFKLFSDASDLAVGSCLMQEHDGILYSIAYFSKKLNTAQRNYSTIEKELLAVILSLKHFESYISPSTPTHLYVDHNPLTSLKRLLLTKHNSRLVRWSLLLQEYNLEISHIKGTHNVVADALSRGVT